MKDSRTWLITFAIVFTLIQAQFVTFVFKNFGLENIKDDKFITIVGTIGAVCNGLSRGFWANLLDRFPYKIVFGCLIVLQIGLGFTIGFISKIRVLYLIWIALSYWCLGGYFSMTPTICAKLYGTKTGGKVYSIVFLFFVPCGIICLILSKTLYKSIGYGKYLIKING